MAPVSSVMEASFSPSRDGIQKGNLLPWLAPWISSFLSDVFLPLFLFYSLGFVKPLIMKVVAPAGIEPTFEV